MKFVYLILLTVLMLLALASGVAKILLLPREVEFFAAYGFSSAMLMVFGLVQLAGALLLIAVKTRMLGASLVGITFVISAVLLVMAGNFAAAAVTGLAMLGLGAAVKLGQRTRRSDT